MQIVLAQRAVAKAKAIYCYFSFLTFIPDLISATKSCKSAKIYLCQISNSMPMLKSTGKLTNEFISLFPNYCGEFVSSGENAPKE